MRHALLFTLITASTVFAGPLELSSVKVFAGREGQRLEVGYLKPAADKQALVRFQGTGSDADGLVVLGKLETQGVYKEDAFVTRVHGSDGATFFRIKEGYGTAWAPGGKEFDVKFLELGKPELSKELLDQHTQQKQSGALAMLAKKEFPNLVKKYEAKAADALAEVNKACSASLTFTYDWASFSDEDMENISVSDICVPMLTAAKSKCGALKGVTALKCKMGPKMDLQKSADGVVFTTTPKGKADAASFVSSNLK